MEQWKSKSADGISLSFISIWLVGDVLNLAGALWASLLPEVITIAVWFCIVDGLMFASYFYYARYYPTHHRMPSHEGAAEETDALVNRRRRSSALTSVVLENTSQSVFTMYVLPMLFVVGAGCLGYFFSDSEAQQPNHSKIDFGPQVIGYLSALMYWGARIPQIIRNHRRKSVEGLSLLFFLFSTLGNITYAGQILFYRSDSEYILLNFSWLLGSVGTIFEDAIIYLQFYIYKDHHYQPAITQEN